MENRADIVKGIAVANAACGGDDLDKAVVRVFLDLLKSYEDREILAALRRCAREVRGRLVPADVISRIDDGWPEPQAAWMLCPHSEADTTVWTNEMAEAFEAVRLSDNRISARVAFIEIYSRQLAQARAEGRRPSWWVSQGHSPAGREAPVLDAVARGRLAAHEAARFLPDPRRAYELAGTSVPLLEGEVLTEDEQKEIDDLIASTVLATAALPPPPPEVDLGEQERAIERARRRLERSREETEGDDVD